MRNSILVILAVLIVVATGSVAYYHFNRPLKLADVCVEYEPVCTHWLPNDSSITIVEPYYGGPIIGDTVDIPCAGEYLVDGVENERVFSRYTTEHYGRICETCGSDIGYDKTAWIYTDTPKTLTLVSPCDLRSINLSYDNFVNMKGRVVK